MVVNRAQADAIARASAADRNSVIAAIRGQNFARARAVGGPGDRGAAERFSPTSASAAIPSAVNRLVGDPRSGGYNYLPSRGPGDRGAAERPGAPAPAPAPAPAAPAAPFSPTFPDDPFLNAPPGSNAMGVDLDAINAALGGGGGDGGGDGGGGGGGGGGGPAPAPAASGPSWAELLEEQRREAARLRGNLDREYESRSAELRSQYQFAETDEERAQLAFLMAELEDATNMAYESITAGYEAATSAVVNLGTSAFMSAEMEAQAIQDLFTATRGQLDDETARALAASGLQGGLVGEALQGAQDVSDVIAADAARQAALSGRLSQISQEDFTAAQARFALQQQAQQADLARQSAGARTDITAQQQRAVADRIAKERLDYAQRLAGLQSTYAQLGVQYDRDFLSSFGTQAGLTQEAQLQQELIRAEMDMLQMQLAAERGLAEAAWAREDASKEAWQTPELSQALLAWEVTPETQRTPERARQIFGDVLPDFFAGVENAGLTRGQQADADRAAGAAEASAASPLVELTDEDILERAREIEEEDRRRRRAEADRLRADAIERAREQYGYSRG